MKNETKTTLSCMDNSRGFQIKGLRGYTLSIGIGSGHYCENQNNGFTTEANEHQPTATMEVAILCDETNEFVCLPYDVAGHVPCGNLGSLIAAVQAHDWEHVCLMCGENGEPDYSKFPLKD